MSETAPSVDRSIDIVSDNARGRQGFTHDARFDETFPLEQSQLVELRPSLIRAGVKAKRSFPARTLDVVFLDDNGLSTLEDLAGGYDTQPLHSLRWYNGRLEYLTVAATSISRAQTDKRSCLIHNVDSLEPITMLNVEKIARRAKLEPSDLPLAMRRPSLAVSFRRNYFEVTPYVGLTLDTDIRYRQLRPLPHRSWVPSPLAGVLSVHAPPRHSAEAARYVHDLPFRTARHSHYLLGMTVLMAL